MRATALKTPETPFLESWDEVDALLRQIKEKQNELDKLKSDALKLKEPHAREVERIDIETKAHAVPIQNLITTNEKLIEEFTRAHASELDKVRTKTLPAGSVSLRKAKKWLWPTGPDFKALCKKLLSIKRFKKYFTFEPTLNKREFCKDPQADKYVSLAEGDEFHYELK